MDIDLFHTRLQVVSSTLGRSQNMGRLQGGQKQLRHKQLRTAMVQKVRVRDVFS